MKAFLLSVAIYAVLVAVTGFVFVTANLTATEAYSRDSVRVGHDNPVDGRLGWEDSGL
jgi:hypothetical protein